MLFLIKATFKAGVEARRQALQADFNEHLAQQRPRVRLAGPVLDDAGARLGVMLLVEADDRAEAERFVQESPYTQAELYQGVAIDRIDLEVGALA